jgi:hypothetical protein
MNRGGLSKNATKKSKLLGIARWLQQRVMWYSGHGDALFEDDDDSSYDEKSSNDESSIESGNDETAFDFDNNYESASEEMSDIED